ncbi:hypothetical protein ACEWY4_026691 [Coilia grayii]|uniref:Adhesion G-protein coupled receptor G4-like n=1 Tax=Coilia grayii TaxID=363190 RepID=A0ABD1IQT8_9TELE
MLTSFAFYYPMKMDSVRVHFFTVVWIWITSPHICSGSSNSSFWGKKATLVRPPCHWQLSNQCVVPELEELSVCVTIQREIHTSEWTAFDYKQRGQIKTELGLVGSERQLTVWLFKVEHKVNLTESLTLHHWHTFCLTWSAKFKQLRLYVNASRLAEIPTDGSRLAGNGMLTLGVSHSMLGGVMDYETGKELMGNATLFRMWGRELGEDELTDLRCVDGDVVSWTKRHWDLDCQPVPDSSLICEWTKYKIDMNVSIKSNPVVTEMLKAIVLKWFKDTFQSNVSVHGIFISSTSSSLIHMYRYACLVYVEVTPKADVLAVQEEVQKRLTLQYDHDGVVVKAHPASINVISIEAFPNVTERPSSTTDPPTLSTAPTTAELPICPSVASLSSSVTIKNPDECSPDYSDEFQQDTFYRVHLNASINVTVIKSANIIKNWLNVKLNPQSMTVLNFEMNPDLHKYGCTFQVQANSLNITETTQRIYSLLTEVYITDAMSIQALPGHINISHIAPGSCPDHLQQTLYGLYDWPRTEPEDRATLLCEKNSRDQATRFCKLDGMTDKAMWKRPDLSLCERTVDDITDLDKVNVTANNSGEIVDMIGSLVGNGTDLNDSQLDTVLDKLDDVVSISPVSPGLAGNIVEIISNVLHSKADLASFTNKILRLTDSVGDTMNFDGEAHNITAPSLALQLVTINSNRFQGLTFGVSSFTNNNSPEIFMNKTFVEKPQGAVAAISLPVVLENFFPRNNTATPRIQFQFYDSAVLFKNPSDTMKLNSYVVSASMTNVNVSNLQQPIIITLRHLNRVQNQDQPILCVYWDFTKSNGGGWESQGCKTESTDGFQTTCHCDHLTHFGVLLDVSKAEISTEDEEILTIISYLGCGLSSIFLGVTLVTYLAFEKLRQDYPSKILINLSLALLGLNLVFLLNSWFASFGSRGVCVSVAAIQHFFVLASFTWMGLEALHMYFALVKVFNTYVPSYILKFCVLGWGIPAVIIILILAIDRDVYGSSLDGETQDPLKDSSPL